MPFIIEFQPLGFRLVCSEPVTLLDAARQAGINLRSDCGGAGICGKCITQIFPNNGDFPPTEAENSFLSQEQLKNGFRLACETIVSGDLKVYIPSDSVIEGQVLQINGSQLDKTVEPLVHQITIELNEAKLNDLTSDLSRLKNAAGIRFETPSLEIIRQLPTILRANNWRATLLVNDNEPFTITDQPVTRLIGLAVDVGSTKLACYLMDLQTGEIIAAKGVPNPQIAYGEDIMARLAFAIKNHDNAALMHNLLMQSINQASAELCALCGASQSEIVDTCLVGNTAMHHFFLDLPVESLAFSPFVAVISDTLYPYSNEVGLAAMPGSRVYAPPVTAGFIGSDHLAFLLNEGFADSEKIRLGIDIGTNTEIALQKNERVVSVSTASGPAFEGAQIRFGMRAAPGAIEYVNLGEDGTVHIEVIGNIEPIGICGSGILDVVSEMRRVGILNKRGRMEKSATGVKLDNQGKPFFVLAQSKERITISQNDIDQILLAKGAIRAGIDILMDSLNISPQDIEEVLIAGAFGSYLRPEHAMHIGMLPKIPMNKVRAVGNAAGSGARMLLISKAGRQKADRLAQRIEYLELTVYPEFPLFFARGIQA